MNKTSHSATNCLIVFLVALIQPFLVANSEARGFLSCHEDHGVIIEAWDGFDCTPFTSSITYDSVSDELVVVVTQVSSSNFSRLRIRSNRFIDEIRLNIPVGISQNMLVTIGNGLGTTDTPNGIGSILRVGRVAWSSRSEAHEEPSLQSKESQSVPLRA